MTQLTVPVASDVLYVGEESTYGSAATTAFAEHVQGSAKPKLSQTEIEKNSASARLFAQKTTVQGLKSTDSGIAFAVHMKPASSVLDTGATASTPYLGTLLECLLGGEYAAAGSTVSGGSATTTSIPVQTGHGTRFRIGTVVAVEVASVRYFRAVVNIATDTLTVWPALPSAPANGDDVLNGYSYFLTQSNSKSLTIEHSHTVPSADAETIQRRLLGCTGGLSLEVGQNNLAQFGFDLRAADWAYGSLSVSSAVGSETMADPIAITNAIVYLQPAATTTDSHVCTTNIGATFNTGMTHLKCLAGVQGTKGVARMGGRDSGEFTIRTLVDTDNYTRWSAQTLLRMLMVFESGSGNSKRAGSVFANRVQIVGNPVEVEEGGFLYQDVRVRPVLDTSLAVDTATGAPYVIGLA